MVEPRSSVVNKEEVNADNWETNIGIIEGEGDGTMDLAQFRLKLPSNSGAILKESPKRPPHIELSLKQSFIQSRLQHLSRQTIMSESRMVSKGPEG